MKMRTKKIVLCSPNLKSNGLKALANKLSEKVGYRVYRVTPVRVRNRRAIHFMGGIDKVVQFTKFHQNGVCAPNFVLNVGGVDNLSSKLVVARTLTNSSEGRGIVIFEKGTTPPHAPLYTEYIPKKKEFRAHVWNNEVFDVAEKRKRRGYAEERNTQVRNTANGYVFCRDGVVEPEGLRDLATSAVRSLGRSYGAVDIIWNEKQNKCYVLEVNSRPGLQGVTVDNYASAILKSLNM